eukprot:CAMPEP_0197331996 /NCGR_PEP_ID=MMETSP0892-20130614/13770_1 /TAXON_ID=44058 ORGANISM="Aureoumbra lagunensis, Strain CCMP1510" /NCGR_SAMPLE_ID=MMETSP0892 /ASSEMBLY_ACC=CAM_ASM_000538 /LENGTH=183 /DNA_ID=CAMNT_0042830285 /DNA_START=132 /DNA_END=681 /DNA_ORIENTATION=+
MEYDWVINKLRSRGFKTLQDRRNEAEGARRSRLIAWEAEKARRLAAGECSIDKKPGWWGELKVLPGAERDEVCIPEELMSEEQLEEKKLREKWGGTVAENVPISDLKISVKKVISHGHKPHVFAVVRKDIGHETVREIIGINSRSLRNYVSFLKIVPNLTRLYNYSASVRIYIAPGALYILYK